MDLTQRHLVNRRIRFADGELVTKYVFPFWDREWRVVFHLIDRLGRPPVILSPPLALDPDGRLSSPAGLRDLREVAAVNASEFQHTFHYDPWWVFRGIGGVSDAVKRTILPTNIATPFVLRGRRWKIHDVELEGDGARVRAIVAKDEVFRARAFTKETLDLATLVPRP